MEPLELCVVRNDLKLSANKVVLEVSGVSDYRQKFSICWRVVISGFFERFGTVAKDSPEDILYLSKDGTEGKLTQ